MTDTATRHVRAVQADYDARSVRWPEVYRGSSFHDVLLQRRMSIALEMLQSVATRNAMCVLDIGCGAGQLVDAMSRDMVDPVGGRVVGVDVSRLQTKAARALAESTVVIAQAEAGRLPFADGAFAVVTALGLLEYLPAPIEGLAECARVIERGGFLIASMPNPLRLAYLCDPVGALLGRLRHTRPGYRRRYRTARGLAADLQACGFELVDLRGHAIGRFTFAGRPLLTDAAAVRLSARLERWCTPALLRLFGANLVAVARRP